MSYCGILETVPGGKRDHSHINGKVMLCCTSRCDIKRQDEKTQVLFQRTQEKPRKILAFSPGRGGMGWAPLIPMCIESLKTFFSVCTCVSIHVYLGMAVRLCWVSSSVLLFFEVGSLTDLAGLAGQQALGMSGFASTALGLQEQARVLRIA